MPLEMPESLPAELRPIWEELAPSVSYRIGAVGLEALCVQVARMRDARRRLDAEGMIVADARGNAVQHPALGMERAAQAEVRTWLQRFGVPK